MQRTNQEEQKAPFDSRMMLQETEVSPIQSSIQNLESASRAVLEPRTPVRVVSSMTIFDTHYAAARTVEAVHIAHPDTYSLT